MNIKCNNLNFIDYQYLNGNDDSWLCIKCNTKLFPFGTLNNKTFNKYIDSSNIQNKDTDEDQFHDFKDPENVVIIKYYQLEEVQTIKIPNKKNSLFLFRINACSLSENFEGLEYLLKTTNTNLDILAISETRILKIPTL